MTKMEEGHYHSHRKGGCHKTLVKMSEYVDDDIKPSDKKTLEQHLSGCKPCMAVLNTLKKTIEVFRGAGTPKLPPSVKAALKREIAREKKA